MSNLGCRILYGVMNQRSDVWCERCYAPWGDMEEEMRREGLLLYGLESGDAIADFDIIGFSLGYEMAYTNVLNMLDLAGLPLRSEERRDLAPLVVAGGTCAYNPEPLAPFVDFFVLGEGEEVTLEYIDLYQQANEEGWSKEEFLQEAAKIPGIYVPSLYEVTYRPDGVVEAVTAGLVSIWFVLGAVAGLLAAVLGAALWVQIVLFFVVSIAALAATRPLVQKMLHRDETPTNADRVLGQTARVTETIDNTVPTGAVYADGKTWTARSASGRVIPKDTLVKVQRMEGVRLFVEEEAGQPVHS